MKKQQKIPRLCDWPACKVTLRDHEVRLVLENATHDVLLRLCKEHGTKVRNNDLTQEEAETMLAVGEANSKQALESEKI
jgi:hypothetical protein